MKDAITIRIPADMDQVITALDETINVGAPIYCAGASENPDDFCLSFYADGEFDDDPPLNHRATMIALAAGDHLRTDDLEIRGDVLMVGDPGLLQKIIDSDVEFQEHAKVIKAFKTWMLDYATANDMDAAHLFYIVHRYTEHVTAEAMDAAQRDHAESIAALLGLDPQQVGVFFV